jgi:hypothetical protein
MVEVGATRVIAIQLRHSHAAIHPNAVTAQALDVDEMTVLKPDEDARAALHDLSDPTRRLVPPDCSDVRGDE